MIDVAKWLRGWPVDVEEFELCAGEIERLRQENERLRHENDALRNGLDGADRLSNAFAETACRRGARMQVIRDWFLADVRSAAMWKMFLCLKPEAADWFDEDGVPR